MIEDDDLFYNEQPELDRKRQCYISNKYSSPYFHQGCRLSVILEEEDDNYDVQDKEVKNYNDWNQNTICNPTSNGFRWNSLESLVSINSILSRQDDDNSEDDNRSYDQQNVIQTSAKDSLSFILDNVCPPPLPSPFFISGCWNQNKQHCCLDNDKDTLGFSRNSSLTTVLNTDMLNTNLLKKYDNKVKQQNKTKTLVNTIPKKLLRKSSCFVESSAQEIDKECNITKESKNKKTKVTLSNSLSPLENLEKVNVHRRHNNLILTSLQDLQEKKSFVKSDKSDYDHIKNESVNNKFTCTSDIKQLKFLTKNMESLIENYDKTDFSCQKSQTTCSEKFTNSRKICDSKKSYISNNISTEQPTMVTSEHESASSDSAYDSDKVTSEDQDIVSHQNQIVNCDCKNCSNFSNKNKINSDFMLEKHLTKKFNLENESLKDTNCKHTREYQKAISIFEETVSSLFKNKSLDDHLTNENNSVEHDETTTNVCQKFSLKENTHLRPNNVQKSNKDAQTCSLKSIPKSDQVQKTSISTGSKLYHTKEEPKFCKKSKDFDVSSMLQSQSFIQDVSNLYESYSNKYNDIKFNSLNNNGIYYATPCFIVDDLHSFKNKHGTNYEQKSYTTLNKCSIRLNTDKELQHDNCDNDIKFGSSWIFKNDALKRGQLEPFACQQMKDLNKAKCGLLASTLHKNNPLLKNSSNLTSSVLLGWQQRNIQCKFSSQQDVKRPASPKCIMTL